MSNPKNNPKSNQKNSPQKSGKQQQNESADTSDLFENRLRKLETLQAAGQDPYQQDFHPSHAIGPVAETPAADFGAAPEEGAADERARYQLAGRVRSKRLMGKAGFMDVEVFSGRLQLYTSKQDLGERFEIFTGLDLGDIIGVSGFLFTTKPGQTTLHVLELTLLSKSLRPLPVVKEDAEGNVYDAFSDREQRYRMRYVDLIVNQDVRETFMMRSKIVQEIRATLVERGYLEVETPMLHPIPGGASARPFVTHHNTLDMELYLRIAPELYLKRLIVGGFPKVFEVNRNFRNEGISIKHNPEFTMLELYEAYGNMQSMLELCEELIAGTAKKLLGSYKIPYGDFGEIDLTPPWERLPYLDAIEKYSGVRITDDMSLDDARKAARETAKLPADLVEECASIWQVAEASAAKSATPLAS